MNNLFLTHKILKINKELANITDTINHMINTPEIFGYQDISDFFYELDVLNRQAAFIPFESCYKPIDTLHEKNLKVCEVLDNLLYYGLVDFNTLLTSRPNELRGSHGICYHTVMLSIINPMEVAFSKAKKERSFSVLRSALYARLEGLFSVCSGFSGNFMYPVKPGDDFISEKYSWDMFDYDSVEEEAYERIEDVWEGGYGLNRRAMLEELIEIMTEYKN
ncbi:hypothetical protein TH1_157 [Shewanella phage Thanatos-1]|nr:hypothetical protein TH1_157 [Shewanella phage Thanatos-1]